MAVTEEPAVKKAVPMRDYWSRFETQMISIIIAMQCVITFLVITILTLSGIVDTLNPVFWLTMVVMTCATAGANYFIYRHIAEPFYDLVRAVVHVSGEQTTKTPPNPNIHRYEEDGFKQILQTVYELASHDSIGEPQVAAPDPILAKGLDQTKTGIIILNSEKQIIYNNKRAPVHINTKGEKILDLLFSDNDSLSAWIDECEKRSVHAEEVWSRVPDRPAGEKNRRIYDVVASYQKGTTAETVVTLFDRTLSYSPEEDDLDFISFAAHELRGPHLHEETLATIYDSIKDDMQLRAASQNRLLIVNLPDTLPTVAADANSVGEVFSNLIDNAIKYSNEGGQIVVTADVVGNFVEVSVKDRGIGMPVNVIPNLFHKFYRSHRSRETVAGTGIGLYISKAIVESHGGIITARSAEREGSTFAFTLPTYDSVAEKLKAGDNSNQQLIEHGSGWIRNHSLYRG
ncbi:MAG: hypothetical protein EOO17_03215 [Chloroflexi bacterium]|nr:MAG: hypothetical protein EOO17_03215 [Chloroflexota bacterium]